MGVDKHLQKDKVKRKKVELIVQTIPQHPTLFSQS